MRIVRIRGSHHVLARGGLRTSVPVHGKRALKIGTLKGILRDVDLGPTEFELAQLKRLQKQLADGHLEENKPLIQKGSTPARVYSKEET